jgi:cytochrome c-type biogenesis protein CcmH/NrfF
MISSDLLVLVAIWCGGSLILAIGTTIALYYLRKWRRDDAQPDVSEQEEDTEADNGTAK